MNFLEPIRRVMKAIRITKIAAVDVPCQEGAVAAIIKRDPDQLYLAKRAELPAEVEAYLKRDFSADQRKEAADKGQAMPDGSFPIENGADLKNAIRAIGRAKDPAAAKKHIKSRAKALGMTDELPDTWEKQLVIAKKLADLIKSLPGVESGDAETFAEAMTEQVSWDGYWKAQEALRGSICSIVEDDSVTDKKAMIQSSLNEFGDYMLTLFADQMSKALAAGSAVDDTGAAGNGDEKMNSLKKSLGLLDTATEADILAAINKRASDAETATAIAALTAPQFTFYKSLTGDDAAAFLKADAEGKKKKMDEKAPPADDEVEKMLKRGDAFKAGDVIMTKRDFGTEQGFQFAKRQQAQLDQQTADIAKRAEADELADFSKRAKDLGFGVEFGDTIRKAYKGDATAQKALEEKIAGMKKAIDSGALFATFGGRDGAPGGSAAAEMNAKAEAFQKSEGGKGLTFEQAYAKVYTDPANNEIKKRMRDENPQQ